jgi:hypothetical protein
MEAHIEFDPRTAFLSVSGAVDDYPAYEGYFLVNNQQQADHIFIHDAAAKPRNLVGGANRQFSKTVDLKSYVAQY